MAPSGQHGSAILLAAGVPQEPLGVAGAFQFGVGAERVIPGAVERLDAPAFGRLVLCRADFAADGSEGGA